MRSTDRCTDLCRYPCAKDHRTRSEKIAAMRAGATTPGERAAADAAAARVKPDPPPRPQPQPLYGTSWRQQFTSTSGWDDATFVKWTQPTPQEARPSGARARFWSEEAQYVDDHEKLMREMLEQELLRRAEATLRGHGFAMPGDPGFEAAAEDLRRAQAQEVYRRPYQGPLHRRRQDGKVRGDNPEKEE